MAFVVSSRTVAPSARSAARPAAPMPVRRCVIVRDSRQEGNKPQQFADTADTVSENIARKSEQKWQEAEKPAVEAKEKGNQLEEKGGKVMGDVGKEATQAIRHGDDKATSEKIVEYVTEASENSSRDARDTLRTAFLRSDVAEEEKQQAEEGRAQ